MTTERKRGRQECGYGKEIKAKDMERLAAYRQYLRSHPRLTYLFVELTDACNLHCLHCGSRCGKQRGNYIDTNLLLDTLAEVADDFEPQSVMVCLSGGEPLLHPDFFRIVRRIADLGFPWGVTTNGTLIDEKTADLMKGLGLGSITISIDGMEEEHDRMRQVQGAYDKAVKAVSALHKADIPVQVTSVIHKGNFRELENMYQSMCEMQVDSWRLVNMEPIGRAMDHREMLLSAEQFDALLRFVREKRYASGTPMDIRYGCSHYLSFDYERMVRDNYFICGSGIYVGSILCNGDIYSCLDIERRRELVQGNIRQDRFSDVWNGRFKEFRVDRSSLCERCASCDEKIFCGGDSTHTWDFDANEPMFCYARRKLP